MSTGLWGKYRAEVIDVRDPDERGRLLVKAPKVLGEFELGWANACLPPGVFDLPKVGDFVYIEFELGKIENPVWVGMIFTRKYVKSTFFPDSAYDPETVKIIAQKDMTILPGDELLIGTEGEAKPVARQGDAITGTDSTGGSVTLTITGVSSKTKSF